MQKYVDASFEVKKDVRQRKWYVRQKKWKYLSCTVYICRLIRVHGNFFALFTYKQWLSSIKNWVLLEKYMFENINHLIWINSDFLTSSHLFGIFSGTDYICVGNKNVLFFEQNTPYAANVICWELEAGIIIRYCEASGGIVIKK